MRRADRERNAEFAWNVVDKCAYAVVSMPNLDGVPYGVPLNIAREEERVYFHSAMEGQKVELLRRRPQVCLTCVGDQQVDQAHFTTHYASAIAIGSVCEVTEEGEKLHALKLICQRHTPENMEKFPQAANNSLPRVAIFRIDVEQITGKCNPA